MSQPYDASTKYLIETRLADWLPLCGRTTTAELEIINADLSTAPPRQTACCWSARHRPGCCILELVSSRDDDLLPISRHIIYFWCGARRARTNGGRVVAKVGRMAELNGTFQRGFPGKPPYLLFQYQVVRVWEIPPETFLNGGLGVLPLAPLGGWRKPTAGCDPADGGTDSQGGAPDEAGSLWTAADVLMGCVIRGIWWLN